MYKVYCYTSPSGKIYIGQTGQSIKARAGKDGINYQQCPYFYKAIQKYGLENFKVDILKDNLTHEEADYWEEYYINLLGSTNQAHGYNLAEGGQTSHPRQDHDYIFELFQRGYHIKDIQKITGRCRKTILESLALYGISKEETTARAQKNACIQYSFQGEPLATFLSTDEAAKSVHGKMNTLAKAIRNKVSYKGFFWSWLLLPNETIDFSQYTVLSNAPTNKTIAPRVNRKQIREEKQREQKELDEKILQLWNEGKTTGEIAEIVGKRTETVSKRLNDCGIDGKERIKRSAGQYLATRVAAYDKEGNKVGEWNSVAEASRALEVARPNISKVLNGERPYAGGYSWKRV